VNLRQLPNLICVARILLIVPVAMSLYHGDFRLTLLLFGIAAFSDALDGFLAKRFGWATELGRILDPLADKLLLVTVFIMLAVLGYTPLWLSGIVVLRDVVIGVGAVSYRYFFGRLHGRPTGVSKLNTALQLLYVLATVAHLGLDWPSAAVTLMLGAAVFVTTVISGIDYTKTYIRRAHAVTRERRAQGLG
jgi:cardiolipin synthase